MEFTLTIYGLILFLIIGILLIIFHAEIAKFLDNSLVKYTEDWFVFFVIMFILYGFGGYLGSFY